jgi:hypothetical protein
LYTFLAGWYNAKEGKICDNILVMFGHYRRHAMKIEFLAMVIFGEAALSPLLANMPLIDEIAARDKAADDAVAAIRTPEELTAKQAAWLLGWWTRLVRCFPVTKQVSESALKEASRLPSVQTRVLHITSTASRAMSLSL